jgi:hypothetical protein
MAKITQRDNPELWEECKAAILLKTSGTFSPRTLQRIIKLYKERGGGYVAKKKPLL